MAIKLDVIELKVLEDEEDSGVSAIALVDEPAIEKYWVYMNAEEFVNPSKGEREEDFIPRCIEVQVGEGKDTDQATAICYSVWESHKEQMDVGGSLPPYVDEIPKHTKKLRKEYFVDVKSELRSLIAQHNETYNKEYQKCSYEMAKAVYNRAVGAMEMDEAHSSYNKAIAGIARLKAFLHLLAYGKYLAKVYQGMDNDLLPAGHRLAGVKKRKSLFAVEKDKQILVGPAMIPDINIIRKDDKGNPYYVKFTEETIQKIQEKFMGELRNKDTNLDHENNKNADSFVFESWTVEDPKTDKANTVYNLGVPKGTWMVKMKVLNPEVWKAVKEGKYRGFSIEGNFIDKKDYDAIYDEKEMVEEIMRILRS